MMTTRGMKEPQMEQIGEWIARAIHHMTDETVLAHIKHDVEKLCEQFPIYKDLHV